MADKTNDYYDKVDEKAYEQSRQNVSVPDPRSRDLWQSTTISTDESGPRVEDVTPAFAQARADALANPASPDGDVDESIQEDDADAAARAQAEADAIREAQGYVAPTGADAGIYDDPKLEGQIPGENFSAEPDSEHEDERNATQVAEEEKAQTAGAQNVDTTESDQRAPASAEASDEDNADEAKAEQKKSTRRSSTRKAEDGEKDESK